MTDNEQDGPRGADAGEGKERRRVGDRDVYLTRDEQGVTSLADDPEAATPQATPLGGADAERGEGGEPTPPAADEGEPTAPSGEG